MSTRPPASPGDASAAAGAWRLPAGLALEHHERLPSTNDRARELVQLGQAGQGVLVVAEAQSAGRGSRGRSWTTVPGRSLAATLARRLPEGVSRPPRLTLLAAVCACRALEGTGGGPLTIKWPNDLMRGERKAGGLLTEVVADPAGRRWLLVGLGVNLALQPGDLPGGLAALAGDAGLPGGPTVREQVLSAWVAQLDAALADLGGTLDRQLGEDYRRRSWLTGRTVTLRRRGRLERVTVEDVTADGDLVLEGGRLARGEHLELVPEEG